jgi:hypothetical protein
MSDDLDPIINELIDYDIKQAATAEERDYLQQLKHSPDEMIRLFYVRKVAAIQLRERKEQVGDDNALKLGIVSSANIAKLNRIRKMESVMHVIEDRISTVGGPAKAG